MASGNPTLDAAEAGTGIELLNAGPDGPVPPKEDPRRDIIPSNLSSLPSDCTAIILPLSLSRKLDTHQNVSGMPSSSGFEELVKAKVRPPGPSRAEDMSIEEWGRIAGAEHADLAMQVQEAAGGGDVGVYKIQAGVGKEEYYIAALDAINDRIIAVRVTRPGG